MPAPNWAARTFVSQYVAEAKRLCKYWGRYRIILIAALTPLLSAGDLAAVIAAFETLTTVCAILERIPDPPV